MNEHFAGILSDATTRKARNAALGLEQWTLNVQIKLCEISAPTSKEKNRAKAFADILANCGVSNVHTDDVGNVIGTYSSQNSREAPVVLCAHLDTVFSSNVDLTVRRSESILRAPGIADNARGLAGLASIAKIICESKPDLTHPIIFLGSVGEEGKGNLLGVKHYFRKADNNPTHCFIAVDGVQCRRSLAIHRLKATISGDGGHSYAHYGTGNPIHAAGAAISSVNRIDVPSQPKTSLNINTVNGGQAINAIPSHVCFEVDIRSESQSIADNLAEHFENTVRNSVAHFNMVNSKSSNPLQLRFTSTGQRIAGETAQNSPIVRDAILASQLLGLDSNFEAAASTDASYPMSIGISSICIPAGGQKGQTHSLDEWFDTTNAQAGIERLLILTLTQAA